MPGRIPGGPTSRTARRKTDPPLQPIITDALGVRRFAANEIVRHLLDRGPISLNDLALLPFPVEDREQFAMLIGYSLSGIGELSYIRPKTIRRIDAADEVSRSVR